jgi:5-methylcytosine-specific restriction endonuclease McrA
VKTVEDVNKKLPYGICLPIRKPNLVRSICSKRNCKRHVARFGLCSKHDYVKNKKYHRSRQKEMYPKYKKKILARSNKRYADNKVVILQKRKDDRSKNVKKARRKSNKYYQENKIHLAAEERKRYYEKREERCKKTRASYYKNKVKRTKQIKKYNQEHPEVKRRAWEKRYAKESYALEVTSDAYRYMIMAWKGVLMKRDNKCCVYCGAKGKRAKLEAHHIIYKRTQIKLALKENNGCILCKKCHVELHSLNPIRYGRRRSKQ